MEYLEIINKKISEIKPYEKNPRNNENAVDAVANSIKQFGFKVPIVVDKNNVIVAGHTRYKASEKLGLEEVPCIIADDLNEEQIKAFRLADNKVAELSEWDFELLDLELGEIQDIDMTGFGFDLSENEEEIQVVEDEVPEIPDEPKAKFGEIYKLGNHILMCGDSTSKEDVMKLLEGETIDLVVTDPPYNINYGAVNESKYGKERYNTNLIENDNLPKEEFYNFLKKAFGNINLGLKEGGSFYIWYASKSVVEFYTALEDTGFLIKQEIIWNKNSFTLGRQDYQWKHEPCIYGWKEGASHYFINNRNEPTVIEDEINLDKMKKDEMKKLLEDILAEKIPTTVINEPKPMVNDLHPTMKPIKLLARLINNSSKQNEKVLDLFGGSGSTLIACEQLNRKCYMMEYDPKYIDVIIERWENFTGKKAIKLN